MLIPVGDGRGGIVWEWDTPERCPAGHGGPMMQAWGPARCCGMSDILWSCRVEGCGATAVDWDHVCGRAAWGRQGQPAGPES